MSLCITTVVDKNYMAYVPLFVWCIRQVYRSSVGIKIFVRNDCSYNVDADIVPLFQDFPQYKYNTIALRFVVPPEHYEGYDYVYVTDIDMIIMPERISIEDFHKNEMVTTSLCYSNSLRHKLHYEGYNSLTGLHFASRKWFETTERQRSMYYELLKKGLVGLYREYDGVMLYRIAEKSNLPLPQKLKLKKRHHGIHLGNFRLFTEQDKWADRIPMDYRTQWNQWLANKDFLEMVEQCKNENTDANRQLTMLYDFINNPEE